MRTWSETGEGLHRPCEDLSSPWKCVVCLRVVVVVCAAGRVLPALLTHAGRAATRHPFSRHARIFGTFQAWKGPRCLSCIL